MTDWAPGLLVERDVVTACRRASRSTSSALTAAVADASRNDLGRMPAQVGTAAVSALTAAGATTASRRARRRVREAALRAAGASVHPKDEYGCIVTIRCEETGELRSRHFPGLRVPALRSAAAWCDGMTGRWVVQSYSTPDLIAGDLDGARTQAQDRHLGSFVNFPEVIALGRIGRPDLIAPELVLHSTYDVKHPGRRRPR